MKKFIIFLIVLLTAFLVFAEGIKEASDKIVDLSSLKISSPTGAPALGLASIAAENPDQYTFVSAETITAEFANASSDFIVAPVNAGAKLYKMGKSD
ncbi:MAG: hypothetical protein K5634_01235, partial [Sphaerochaetaceae bacterium]|nr:hypothetical protein [Sphaerochaetaceae bacterium]